MDKIRIEPSVAKPAEEPRPQRRTAAAAPFTLQQSAARQTAVSATASSTLTQRQHARAASLASSTVQITVARRNAAVLDACTRDMLSAVADRMDQGNAATRFDSQPESCLPGAFYGDFAETPDSMEEGGASTLAEILCAEGLDESLDCMALARMLPTEGNNGIFDVIFPNGERMGVVVSSQSSALSYLLSPSSEKFGGRLRRQRMELEGRLEQLTHRSVNITVL